MTTKPSFERFLEIWEQKEPRKGKIIIKFHQGCGHGRTPKGRK